MCCKKKKADKDYRSKKGWNNLTVLLLYKKERRKQSDLKENVYMYETQPEGDSVVGYTPAFMAAAAGLIPVFPTCSIVKSWARYRLDGHRVGVGVPGLLNFRTGTAFEGSCAQNA